MAEVVPTITADSPRDYTVQLGQVKPFAKRLHIDIADGLFVDRKLIDLSQVYGVDSVPFDLHLMVTQPEKEIALALSLRPRLIIVHFEAEGDLKRLIREVHESGILVGLAIKPETPVAQVTELLGMVEHLLVFTGARIGYFGGDFRTACLSKIDEARRINSELEIAVDGGIDLETGRLAVEKGADVLDCGSFIHSAAKPEEAYASLDALARGVVRS
jgi:ribulose-phosphate 3-epimerase